VVVEVVVVEEVVVVVVVPHDSILLMNPRLLEPVLRKVELVVLALLLASVGLPLVPAVPLLGEFSVRRDFSSEVVFLSTKRLLGSWK